MSKVWVYTTAFNCEAWLPHFLRHYAFADRVIVYDNESTDNTRGVAESPNWKNVVVRTLDSGNQYREDMLMIVRSHLWKEARYKADWIIIVDPDELMFHAEGLPNYLDAQKTKGSTLLLSTGLEMFSKEFPTGEQPLVETIKTGFRNDVYSKPVIFNPEALMDISYVSGCHECSPFGNVILNEQWYPHAQQTKVPGVHPTFIRLFKGLPIERPLKLLHYRFIGWEFVRDRWRYTKPRMAPINYKYGWGGQYLLEEIDLKQAWDFMEACAKPVI